jgi:hypothetical protein
MVRYLTLALSLLATTTPSHAFTSISTKNTASTTSLFAVTSSRRNWLTQAATGAAFLCMAPTPPASATVYLDPAMYGDQENRVAAVDTLREKVRQAILKRPALAVSFFQLALLDGLSFDTTTKQFGPDGSVVKSVLSSSTKDVYMTNLQEACNVLIAASVSLKKYTAITIPDAVAIAGAEAIESIGGPVLSVQLGRTEGPKGGPLPSIDLAVFNGKASPKQVQNVFRNAGLTDREMTTLLGALLTLENVPTAAVQPKARAKYVERGKMGRMSDYKKLTDEDFNAMAEDDYAEDPDDGWYIADSFGTRDQAFGQQVSAGIDQKSFNKYLKDLNGASMKKGGTGGVEQLGWIGAVLLDSENPTAQSWVNKYGSSNLSYLKDLGIAYNAVTQLGGEFTGGKYENLLKNKPRKTLNDDDLGLGFK